MLLQACVSPWSGDDDSVRISHVQLPQQHYALYVKKQQQERVKCKARYATVVESKRRTICFSVGAPVDRGGLSCSSREVPGNKLVMR